MKKSQLRQLIREEIKTVMDRYPFNQADGYEDEDEDEGEVNLGDEIYSSENYIMRSHPRALGRFYVVRDELTKHGGRKVVCTGSKEKCMEFIKTREN